MDRSRRRSVCALALLVASGLLSACAPHVPPATASQRAQVRITVYTTRWCPVCTRARAWLHQRGIPFREFDVERRPSAAARHAMLNPARTVPTFDIEGRVLVGFVASDVRTAIDRVAHTYPEAERPSVAPASSGDEEPAAGDTASGDTAAGNTAPGESGAVSTPPDIGAEDNGAEDVDGVDPQTPE